MKNEYGLISQLWIFWLVLLAYQLAFDTNLDGISQLGKNQLAFDTNLDGISQLGKNQLALDTAPDGAASFG